LETKIVLGLIELTSCGDDTLSILLFLMLDISEVGKDDLLTLFNDVDRIFEYFSI
jgi:hypothetical protein